MTDSRPTPLAADEVSRALAELAGWSGDANRIRRTATGPADRLPALLEQVAAVETELDHHALAQTEAEHVTFELWTHTVDGVTALDLELARRLEDLLLGNGFS